MVVDVWGSKDLFLEHCQRLEANCIVILYWFLIDFMGAFLTDYFPPIIFSVVDAISLCLNLNKFYRFQVWSLLLLNTWPWQVKSSVSHTPSFPVSNDDKVTSCEVPWLFGSTFCSIPSLRVYLSCRWLKRQKFMLGLSFLSKTMLRLLFSVVFRFK